MTQIQTSPEMAPSDLNPDSSSLQVEQQGLIEGLRRQKFSLESAIGLAERYSKSKKEVFSKLNQLRLHEVAQLRVSLEDYAQKLADKLTYSESRLIEDVSELQFNKIKNEQKDELYSQLFVKNLRDRKFCLEDLKRFNKISQLQSSFFSEIGYLLKTRQIFKLSEQLISVLAPLSKTKQEKRMVIGLAEYLIEDFMGRKTCGEQSQFKQSVQKLAKKLELGSYSGQVFFTYYRRCQKLASKFLNDCELNKLVRIFRYTRSHLLKIEEDKYRQLKFAKRCLSLFKRKIKKRISDIRYYKEYQEEIQKEEKEKESPRQSYFNQQYYWLDRLDNLSPPSPNPNLFQQDIQKTDYRLRKIEKQFNCRIKLSISDISKSISKLQSPSHIDSDEEYECLSDYDSEIEEGYGDDSSSSDEMLLSASSVAVSEE